MPRCLVQVEGSDYDVSNLLNEVSYNAWMKMRREAHQVQPKQRRASLRDWRLPLYPNLSDPYNRQLVKAVELEEWKSVPLVKDDNDKYAQFYELQRRDMDALHQQQELPFESLELTSRPQRAQTAPLHAFMHDTPVSPTASSRPACSSNTLAASSPSRQSSPSAPRVARPHRHSTTAVSGDIESSSSGLRPRVNYKSLYNRRRNHSAGSLCGGSVTTAPTIATDMTSLYEDDEDMTTSTMMNSSRRSISLEQFEDPALLESPVEEEEGHEQLSDASASSTMEIAPNVRVAVRSSQETYKAVQSGDYTVATCFACTATIVCVDDAAYVLCPDCQVVSPLGSFGTSNETSKKDDPYGIGTGIKREWVNEFVGSI